MGKHLALHVTIQVAPESVDSFLEALRPCWAGCASEPECLFFDVYQDVDTPGLFRFVEMWSKDKEWFVTQQLTKDYYHPYEEITKPMWIRDRHLQFTERESGWFVYKEEYLVGSKKM